MQLPYTILISNAVDSGKLFEIALISNAEDSGKLFEIAHWTVRCLANHFTGCVQTLNKFLFDVVELTGNALN